ncbi:MAG: hypothetical protein N4A49_01995 [Marinifilaceae bacterium]|jgi:hypothetical protein|nr:hypothetical protein [Marinifilaceae bacterium]
MSIDDQLKKLQIELHNKKRLIRSIKLNSSRFVACNTTDKEQLDKYDNIYEIPNILKSFISQFGGYSAFWKIPDKQNPNRVFSANSINYGTNQYEMFGSFRNILDYSREGIEQEIPFYKYASNAEDEKFWNQFYILDHLKYGKLILIKVLENDENNAELYLFEHPVSLTKLTVNLIDYLKLFIKTGGLSNWQEYLTEESYILDGAIPDYFHEKMKLLFPEEDLGMFRKPPKLEDSIYNRYLSKENKQDYQTLFLDTIAKLKAKPKVQFNYSETDFGFLNDKVEYSAYYGVDESVLRKIKKDYGRELPESMLAFFYQMNGCKLNWQYFGSGEENYNENYIEANLNILPLEQAMGGKYHQDYLDWSSPSLFKDEDSTYYYDKEMSELFPELAQLMTHARLIDDLPDSIGFFIDFEPNREDPTIYKVIRNDYYKIDIDFSKFIEARIMYAGISGWEYQYINHSDYSEEFKERMFNEFKTNLKMVLGEMDFSLFEK